MPEAVSRVKCRPLAPPRSRAKIGILKLTQNSFHRIAVHLADVQHRVRIATACEHARTPTILATSRPLALS